MKANWNRLIPLILFAVCGVALLITGAVLGASELIVTGTAMSSFALGAATPTGAIAKAAEVLVLGFFFAGAVSAVGCGSGSEETTACYVTQEACRACEAARDRWCGGPPVEVEDTAGGEQ